MMSAKQATPLTSGRRIYGHFSHYTGRFGVTAIEGSKSRAMGGGGDVVGGDATLNRAVFAPDFIRRLSSGGVTPPARTAVPKLRRIHRPTQV